MGAGPVAVWPGMAMVVEDGRRVRNRPGPACQELALVCPDPGRPDPARPARAGLIRPGPQCPERVPGRGSAHHGREAWPGPVPPRPPAGIRAPVLKLRRGRAWRTVRAPVRSVPVRGRHPGRPRVPGRPSPEPMRPARRRQGLRPARHRWVPRLRHHPGAPGPGPEPGPPRRRDRPRRPWTLDSGRHPPDPRADRPGPARTIGVPRSMRLVVSGAVRFSGGLLSLCCR